MLKGSTNEVPPLLPIKVNLQALPRALLRLVDQIAGLTVEHNNNNTDLAQLFTQCITPRSLIIFNTKLFGEVLNICTREDETMELLCRCRDLVVSGTADFHWGGTPTEIADFHIKNPRNWIYLINYLEVVADIPVYRTVQPTRMF